MKLIVGLFPSRELAEKVIDRLHHDLSVDTQNISYMYRSVDGTIEDVDPDDIATDIPAKNAKKGAAVGGGIGAMLGLAAVVGIIPVIGPIVAAGPLVTALGIGTMVGTTAAGAITGAAAGGVIGVLTTWGADETNAKEYEERILSGDILVAVSTDKVDEAAMIFDDCGALKVTAYSPTL